uniref:Uncharacterized protein n=1 Tax=Micrurus corallinus TaxID=54390 RepID=A0A2D4FAY9_MICCO
MTLETLIFYYDKNELKLVSKSLLFPKTNVEFSPCNQFSWQCQQSRDSSSIFFPTFDICMLRKLKKEGRPRKTDLFSKPQIYGICLVFVPLFFSFIQCILKSFFIYCDRAYFLKEGEIHYYPNAVHSCN